MKPWGRLLQRLEIAVLLILGIAAVMVMFGNSVARYVFQHSFTWAEEVVRILFVWSMFIAITTGFIRNQHIGFLSLVGQKPWLWFISRIMYKGVLAYVGFVVAYYGMSYNSLVGHVPLAGTNFPTALFLIPGIIAGFAWMLIGAAGFIQLIAAAVRRRSVNLNAPEEK